MTRLIDVLHRIDGDASKLTRADEVLLHRLRVELDCAATVAARVAILEREGLTGDVQWHMPFAVLKRLNPAAR